MSIFQQSSKNKALPNMNWAADGMESEKESKSKWIHTLHHFLKILIKVRNCVSGIYAFLFSQHMNITVF